MKAKVCALPAGNVCFATIIVPVGLMVPGPLQAENSEVLPSGSVAVAVTTAPAASDVKIVYEKLRVPLASMVTLVVPR